MRSVRNISEHEVYISIVGQVVDCAPGPQGCRANFSSPGQCCTESFTCGQDLERLPTCQLNGRTYYAGEKMYPEVTSAES